MKGQVPTAVVVIVIVLVIAVVVAIGMKSTGKKTVGKNPENAAAGMRNATGGGDMTQPPAGTGTAPAPEESPAPEGGSD